MSCMTEAARRLGAPVVECAGCHAMAHLDEAVLVMAGDEERRSGWMVAEPVSGPRFCSIRCTVEYGANRLVTIRAFHWSRRNEAWVQIGVRVAAGSTWDWTDTGESRWIEENAARLREGGEIS